MLLQTKMNWMNYQKRKKLRQYQSNGLTKNLINKVSSIINETKYFSLGILQNYLVFVI